MQRRLDSRAAPPPPSCAPSGALAEGEELPCLSNDNCDNDREEPSSEAKKRAFSVVQNVQHFVDTYGIDNCGFFTVTFPEDLTCKEAQRRIHNFARRVLSDLFGEYVRVREFTSRGRPHYHFVVECKGDIRTGFNWEHYDAVRDWSRSGRRGKKPSGSLGRSPLLVELHDRLNSAGPAYGIGRMELTPIRANSEAIGVYVGGYLVSDSGRVPPDAKGTRAVVYSQGFSRVVKGRFAWNGENSQLYRLKLSAWAARHGCSNLDELKALFGPRWAYHFRDSIEGVPIEEACAHRAAQRAAPDPVPVAPAPAPQPAQDDSLPVRKYRIQTYAESRDRRDQMAERVKPSLIQELYPEFWKKIRSRQKEVGRISLAVCERRSTRELEHPKL